MIIKILTFYNYHIKNQEGFSLIEILIAITILTIGMLSLASMQMYSIQGNKNANILSKKNIVASNLLEILLSCSFNDQKLASGDHTPDLLENNDKTNNSLKYTIKWNIKNLSSNKKLISVYIAKDRNKNNFSLFMKTIRIK